MFVRVYDKKNNKYYKSIVYGVIDMGYNEKSICLNPTTESFELIDYLDKEEKDLKPIYEIINQNEEKWTLYERSYLLKFKHYCKEHSYMEEIRKFCGYDEVFNDFDFMLRILRDRKVALKDTNITIRDNEDSHVWNYIKTQDDADYFMDVFVGFHDSVIEKALYEEEYRQRSVTVTFDNSGWYGIAELCFEGVIAMNLRPPGENCSREIYGGCLLIKDECIYWADDCLKEEDMNYQGTFIKALNLKWRKI